jgi:hypothetical protein
MKAGTDTCEICNTPLNYELDNAKAPTMLCNFCNKSFRTSTYCPNNHYICDNCHSNEARRVIYAYSIQTKEKDPYQMMNELLKHSAFKMYGPEHHLMVPVLILTALRNNGCKKPSRAEITDADIKEAINRASKVPGGWCGFYGTCGAAVGAGIALAIFGESNPGASKPRSIANQTTAQSLELISDHLEHCCKRSARYSIDIALKQLEKYYNCKISINQGSCSFCGINEKCVGSECPFS